MRTLRLPTNLLLLALPVHDQSHLPVARRAGGRLLSSASAARALRMVIESQRNNEIVSEFRSKMRLAEDLISKLAFSLNEIQGTRRRKSKTTLKARPANLFQIGADLRNVIRLHE